MTTSTKTRKNNKKKKLTAADLKKTLKSKGLNWVPLGGNEEVGGNCDLFTCGKDAIIMDMGSLFGKSKDDYNSFLPDMRQYLSKSNYAHPSARFSRINSKAKKADLPAKAIFITHGHMDHIGAMTDYARMGYNLPPIYGSAVSIAMIRNVFAFHKLRPPHMIEIKPGEQKQVGDIKVEAIPVSHSLCGAFSYCIETPESRIIYSGDVKTDQTVLIGPKMDLEHYKRISRRKGGVDALLLDSTRAPSKGLTLSEKAVRSNIQKLMDKDEHEGKRVIVSVMGSNLERIVGLLKVAAESDRNVIVEGGAIMMGLKALDLARIDISKAVGKKVKFVRGDAIDSLARANINLNEPDDDTIYVIDGRSMNSKVIKDENAMVLATGTQGEFLAALPRAARGEHQRLRLGANDLVIMSSSIIPGHEAKVGSFLKQIRARRATLVTAKEARVHTSGHGGQGDLKKIIEAVKPKEVIPVHGNDRLTKANAEFVKSLGRDAKRINNWRRVQFNRGKDSKITGDIPRKWLGVREEQNADNYRWTNYYYSSVTSEPKVTAKPKKRKSTPTPKP